MFILLERVEFWVIRVARRVGNAELRFGISGLSGVICS